MVVNEDVSGTCVLRAQRVGAAPNLVGTFALLDDLGRVQ